MGKIAFVFSGQGDQYPGMGKEIKEKYKSAAAIYDLCDKLRAGTSLQCFNGSEEELKDTATTQPCLFAMELAAATVLKEKGVLPAAVAGFSLGEVVAATFSGLFSYEDGFRLVCTRGKLMQQEAEKHDTFMAAVVKLSEEQVKEICMKYEDIYPVNFNCPGQITVSGKSSHMEEFCADIKAASGRALPLKVKGAFHSPFMNDAADAFAIELEKVKRNDQQIPLYSNVTACPYTENVVELLSKQICSPVQWEKIIRHMIDDGIDTFIEIGPGKTLKNMIKKIDPQVTAYTITEYLAEVESC